MPYINNLVYFYTNNNKLIARKLFYLGGVKSQKE